MPTRKQAKAGIKGGTGKLNYYKGEYGALGTKEQVATAAKKTEKTHKVLIMGAPKKTGSYKTIERISKQKY